MEKVTYSVVKSVVFLVFKSYSVFILVVDFRGGQLIQYRINVFFQKIWLIR